jgi:hypothetical protein
MAVTINDLKQDWERAHAALQQQLDLFESGAMGLTLTADQKKSTVTHLKAAIAEYAALFKEYGSAAYMAIHMVTETKGEIFFHRHIWKVVERQLEQAQRNPLGAEYDCLVAMVFAFHTLEGYLNYVGSQLAPELWRRERNEQSIQSFSKKATKIFELCCVPEPDKTARPYKTIWDLQDLRDKIAHPKPIPFIEKVHHTGEEPAPKPNYAPFGDLVSYEKALVAAHDVKKLIAVIHKAASRKIDDVWFGEDGLCGPLGHGQGSTTLAP